MDDPKCSLTAAAVKEHFGSSINLDPRATIDDVFYQVTNGTSQFGMVPFENSSEGVVNATLNCLVDEKLLICGETYLDIEHNLAKLCSISKYVSPQINSFSSTRQFNVAFTTPSDEFSKGTIPNCEVPLVT